MNDQLERYIVGFDGTYHFRYRLSACFKLVPHIFKIYRYLKSAYGVKKTFLKVILDMLLLIWKFGAWVEAYYDVRDFVNDYFKQRLYLIDRNIDKYILQYEGIRVFFAAGFKSMRQFKILDSKILFHEFCDKHKLPHGCCRGYIIRKGENVFWKSFDNKYNSIKELLRFGKMFCKVDLGEQGKGSFSLQLEDDVLVVDSSYLDEKGLVGYMPADEMIVEDNLENHSVLKSLHPGSLQTIRMVTIKKPHEDVFVLASVLRMGRDGKIVDNLSSGGLCVLINPDGTLSAEAWSMDYTQPPYLAHPDTRIKFKSMKIPFWEQCIDLVCTAHQKLPRIVGIGWDVAITPTGPVLVEGNNYFGFTVLQVHGVPYRWITEGEYKVLAERNVNLMMCGRAEK